MPGDDHHGIHVVLPKRTVTIAASFSKVPLPVTITQLGRRVSDILKLCLTTWTRLIDAKLHELFSVIKAMCFSCPVFAYLRSHSVVASRLSSTYLSRLLGLALRRPRSCLFRCRREILPRRRLAHCAVSRALASSSSIFRVASSQSHLVVLFCCSRQMRSSSSRFFGRSRVAVLYLLLGGSFFMYFTNYANLECSRPCAGLLRFPRVFTQNR